LTGRDERDWFLRRIGKTKVQHAAEWTNRSTHGEDDTGREENECRESFGAATWDDFGGAADPVRYSGKGGARCKSGAVLVVPDAKHGGVVGSRREDARVRKGRAERGRRRLGPGGEAVGVGGHGDRRGNDSGDISDRYERRCWARSDEICMRSHAAERGTAVRGRGYINVAGERWK
jgi:hypothetical protein